MPTQGPRKPGPLTGGPQTYTGVKETLQLGATDPGRQPLAQGVFWLSMFNPQETVCGRMLRALVWVMCDFNKNHLSLSLSILTAEERVDRTA